MNKRILIVAMLPMVVGCVGPFAPCQWVERSVSASIEADPSATGAVYGGVTLTDSRHDDDPRFPDEFSWGVRFAPTNSADSLFTDVHMHELATDDILLTLPVSGPRHTTLSDPDLYWVVSSPRSGSYQSSVPFDVLYRFVRVDSTYIDVHTVAHPAGARGRVTATSFTNWTEMCVDTS
jgi:hypothetical protein